MTATFRNILAAAFSTIAFATSFAEDGNIVFSTDEIALLRSFGPWPPPVPCDPGNEFSDMPWAEVLGEKLFNDPLLSGDQSLSCASCHQKTKGFSDGHPVATGAATHVRNTQSLLNVGYQRWFGWDGGTDSLWAASLRPILSELEMNADIDTVATRLREQTYFVRSLQDIGINIQITANEELLVIAAKTIGAYQRTLISGATEFDSFAAALVQGDTAAQRSYPVEAQRGMKLFFGEGNCHVCHFGPNFSNGEFHDTGRPFFTGVGQVDPGRYSGISRVRADPYNLLGVFNGTRKADEAQKTGSVKLGQVNFGQWRTPGLRGLVHTAPYMHDGSLESLREVVDSYADIDPDRLHTQGEALLRPLNWSAQDREDVVSFLESLSQPAQ